MMKFILFIIIFLPKYVGSQDLSIDFEKSWTWENVLAKAKNEKKQIFVDCYASWCAPCKWMDKEVYNNDSVAKFVNEQFVSIKLQFDLNINDIKFKQQYQLADSFKKKYQITEFPTLIFFSPDGDVVSKEIGALSSKNFIEVCKNSLDPNKQYYRLLQYYQSGILDYNRVPYLAKKAKELKDDSIANIIASDYITNFLLSLKEQDFYNKKNLEFIAMFKSVLNSKSKGFDLFYNSQERIDQILGKGFSESVIDYVISKEEITPALIAFKETGQSPNWKKIKRKIKTKYNSGYAERTIVNAKLMHFKFTAQWNEYAKNLILKIEKYGMGNVKPEHLQWWFLNNYAFEIFLYSSRKKELNKALEWIEKVIKMDITPVPAHLDTKSNLLYKLGRKQAAIELEQRVLEMEPGNKEFQETLDKMKKGLATGSAKN